jgi:hypothetical protein
MSDAVKRLVTPGGVPADRGGFEEVASALP